MNLLSVYFCQNNNWKVKNNKEDTGTCTSKVEKIQAWPWRLYSLYGEEYIFEVQRRLSLIISEMGHKGALGVVV